MKNDLNRFPCGKYKGRLITDIVISDPSYVKWAINANIIKQPKTIKI